MTNLQHLVWWTEDLRICLDRDDLESDVENGTAWLE